MVLQFFDLERESSGRVFESRVFEIRDDWKCLKCRGRQRKAEKLEGLLVNRSQSHQYLLLRQVSFVFEIGYHFSIMLLFLSHFPFVFELNSNSGSRVFEIPNPEDKFNFDP